MAEKSEIKSEARYTFMEATGVLLGHEVGAGILSIPYIASLNNWYDFVWVLVVTCAINILLHLMIAELSLNNHGAQFVECMKNELFGGKETKLTGFLVWVIFCFLGLSVVVNCTAYITGSASVLTSWFGFPTWASMLIYFVFAGFIVFFGMKFVGICEKVSSYILIGVILLFGVIMMFTEKAGGLTSRTGNITVVLGLYSVVSFAMSAVMSVPTVVKGLDGDRKKIRGSIILSEVINIFLIAVLTIATVIGCGPANLSPNNPASLDLGNYVGSVSKVKWLGTTVRIFGGVFSLFAYSTSLWANTLNLRDMVCEQTKIKPRLGWLIATSPSLIIALIFGILQTTTLSKLSTVAAGIQVLTSAAIVVSFGISRKKASKKMFFDIDKTITKQFGNAFWCAIVILSSLIATIGSVVY